MSDLKTTLNKHYPASPEAVFEAWTDPQGLGAWFSPMTTASVPVLDLRVGGEFRIDMHGDGENYVHTGKYLEVERPNRLVFTWISAGTNDQETVVTVEIAADGEGAMLTLTHTGFPGEESRDNHQQGWSAILEKFERVCAGSGTR